jgi:hypothetical protein
MIGRIRSDGAGLVMRAIAVSAIVFSLTTVVGIVAVKRPAILRRLLGAIRARLDTLRAGLTGPPADLPERLHAQALRALRIAGAPKPPGVPLRAHLAEQRTTLSPPLAEALAEACELLYRVRFQRPGAAHPEPERFRRVQSAIRRSENPRRSRPRA